MYTLPPPLIPPHHNVDKTKRKQYNIHNTFADNDNTTPSFIVNVNPYRYRGYYYDVETGLYYLQSRYYDAEVGRFVNGDDRISPYFCLTTNLYSYTLNSPVIHADYMGHDAVLLFESGGAAYMGHAALLVEDSDGTCYYFSVNGKGNGSKKVIEFLRFGKNINIKNLKLINGNIYVASRSNLATYREYDSRYYFKGDFSKSYEWFYNLYKNPDNYNLINNNCLQTAAHALSLGICKGEYAEDYELAIFYLSTMTIPNSANNAMYHFETSISTYYKLPWYIQWFANDLFYYFNNSMYLS